MKKMYLRWMGTFARKSNPLSKSLEFEMTRETEAACELNNGHFNMPNRSEVALVVKPTAIVRKFTRDCWSDLNDQGKLEPEGRKIRNHTRALVKSCQKQGKKAFYHNECFLSCDRGCPYTGDIVISRRWGKLEDETRRAIINFCKHYGSNVYVLDKDEHSFRKMDRLC